MGGQAYDVWVATLEAGGPVHDNEYLLLGKVGQSFRVASALPSSIPLTTNAEGRRFVGNQVPDWVGGGGEKAVWSYEVPGLETLSGGVTLVGANNVTVAHNDFQARYAGSDVVIVLLGSSANLVEDNTLISYGNGVYAGCSGYISAPPAHPLAQATCTLSTGNEIAGNQITVLPGAGRSGLAGAGPAIALGSSATRNLSPATTSPSPPPTASRSGTTTPVG